MVKRIVLLLLLSSQQLLWISVFGQSINNEYNYKKKLAKLFVVPSESIVHNYEYSPGYILKSGNGVPLNHLEKGSQSIIDLRYGKKDQLRFSFPVEKVLNCVSQADLIDSLMYSALLYEYKEGGNGICITSGANESIIMVVADSSLRVKEFQLVNFPKELMKSLPYNDFEKIKIKTDGFSLWGIEHLGELNFLNWDGKPSLNVSFEELLDKGVLFYSENFAQDHAKLVRAFENHLMVINGKIENKYNTDTTGVSASLSNLKKELLAQKQSKLRQNILRQSIAIYQKSNIIPIVDVQHQNGLIWDYRKQPNDDFYNMAGFYHPNLKNKTSDSTKVDLIISLCDVQDKLIEVTESIRLSSISSSTVKVLVTKGLLPSFYNSSLLEIFDAIIVAEANSDITWDMLAQALYGGFGVGGSNQAASHLLDMGFELKKTNKIRLGFSYPECEGFNNDTLELVNTFVLSAIKERATPGAQLLVARNGEIVLQKSYGYHTYSRKRKVNNDDLYDVASVTKLCATLPIIMRLYEGGQINLEDSLVNYLAGIDTTDKKDITIKELLLHQSGLRSFIPFHINAIDQDALNGQSLYSGRYSSVYNIKLDEWYYQSRYTKYREDVFQKHPDSLFNIRVSKNWYMNRNYIDTMKVLAYQSELRTKKDYLYSDIGYHFLHMLIDQKLKEPLDQYYYSTFTWPLGASRMVFNPLNNFDMNVIVPTENDLAFRKELLHGYVHDQAAAMNGGVAANAGVFANSGDLAKISQMFLNKGQYGGVSYFKPETIDYFTSRKDSANRRGLGVDKPETDPEKQSPASLLVSPSSFGHTGFTGTMVWIDPDYQLVYIFLSNRINPRAYNKNLIESNVRTNIQDVVYKSMINH